MYIKIIIAFIIFLLRLSIACSQVVKDIDGNIYITVDIGKQTWMAENLKTTRLNDGKAIPLINNDDKWKAVSGAAYCYYNNSEENKDISGLLYNYHAVRTGKLCPAGWHVPAEAEWKVLVNFLGDPATAGDRLKEAGTKHWKNIFSKASNDYDFSGIPGGMRFYTGVFPLYSDSFAVWWTSTGYDARQARTRGLHDQSSMIYDGFDFFGSGFSVRCIKN